MDNEAFDLPESSDHTNSSAFHPPTNIHPLSETRLPSQSFFSRFVQKVGQIFNKTPEVHDIRLSGRIKELKTIADGLLIELSDFKTTLQQKVDPALYALVLPILDLLLKEAGRAPPPIEKRETTVHRVKLFSRYVESIERAKIWAELGKVNENQLEQAVIRQTAKEFLCRIDRDIQVIQEYLKNVFSSFDMSSDLEDDLKEKLMPGLDFNLVKLQELKNLPSDFSLTSFIEWRSHADLRREALFGSSLHIIDHFASEFLQVPIEEEKTEQFHAISDRLNDLEKKITKVAGNIENEGVIDENRQKSFLALIEKLEAETHELNTNLTLDAENSERIDSFLEILLSLRKKL